jgi:hypothetical protein
MVFQQWIKYSILLLLAASFCGCRKNPGAERRITLRRVPSREVAGSPDQKLELLLRQLDDKFMELQTWKSQVDRNRTRESELLIKIREEIAQLREKISVIQTLEQADEKEKSYYGSGSTEKRTVSSMAAPERFSAGSSREVEDMPELMQKRTTPDSAAAGRIFAPPPVYDRSEINSGSGVKAPPVSSLQSRTKAVKNRVKIVPQQKYHNPVLQQKAQKFEVKLKKGLSTGRILWIERRHNNRVLRIDIGSLAGLKDGDLVSVGGIGAGCSIWEVTSTRKYSSVVRRLEGSPVGGVKRGDRVYQVSRKF